MNKREMDRMESELRERIMKERWRLTAEQEASELPHASNKEIADEKIGKWLSAALEDPATCGAMKDDINEWFQAVEEQRLRTKKKSIHDELYDVVKMEMFKASSKLEGIDYEDNEVQCKSHPDAPHGFLRNESLTQNRYVCECEYWEPEELREITDEEYELFEKLKNIWFHSTPEQSGQYFICGEVGEKDSMGLPEKILVCPAYGSDGMAVYTKTTDYSAPSY